MAKEKSAGSSLPGISRGQGENQRPNIILVVIDALRAENVGVYSGVEDQTPHMDTLARQGVLFENAFSAWNTTDQSLTTIFSGRFPRTHGIIHHGDRVTSEDVDIFQNLNLPWLPEVLRQQGYKTMAVDWMGRWQKKGFDYYGYKLKRNIFSQIFYSLVTLPYLHLRYMAANIGLLRIYARKREASFSSMWKGLRGVLKTFAFTFQLARVQDAGFVTTLAQELIRENKKKPFFLFLHYWDTHSPYNCPRKFLKKKKGKGDAKEMLELKYRGAVRYVDKQIGRLLEEIKAADILENTWIIITSDHGESLTEHQIYFDHHGLYDVTTRVPLIFYYPRLFSPHKRIEAMVQHVDFVPTVCEVLGVECGGSGFDGQSLMPLIGEQKKEIRPYVFNEESYVQRKIGLRTKKFKYIYAPHDEGWCSYCQRVHGGKEELYDLESDPEEKDNIVHQDKPRAVRMREKLDQLIFSLNTKKQRELIRGSIFRLKEEGRLAHGRTTERESAEMKEKRKSLTRKVTLELPEELLDEIEKRIQDTEFAATEDYLSHVIQEVVEDRHTGYARDDKEEKKIKKKLRGLGYMD